MRLVEGLDQPFLVMNGDILTTLDYSELMRRHADTGAALTIATHEKTVKMALGVIEGEDERVTGYIEKPTLNYEVSMGIYAYVPEALEHIPDGHFDFPDLVLALIAAGRDVRTYHFDGAWYDIGTPLEHEKAVAAFEQEPDLFEPETL